MNEGAASRPAIGVIEEAQPIPGSNIMRDEQSLQRVSRFVPMKWPGSKDNEVVNRPRKGQSNTEKKCPPDPLQHRFEGLLLQFVATMWPRQIQRWAKRNDLGRVNLSVRDVVVPFDMVKINGLGDSGLLIKIHQISL